VNRNIITAADAERLRKNFVASLGDRAFGERMLGEPGVPTPPAPPPPDTWYQRLAKYIPAEALSLYLGLDRGLQSANIGNQGLVISLGVALVITMLFNVLYLRRIWKVARLSQVTVSTVALVAYVYVTGGVFKAANIAPPSCSSQF